MAATLPSYEDVVRPAFWPHMRCLRCHGQGMYILPWPEPTGMAICARMKERSEPRPITDVIRDVLDGNPIGCDAEPALPPHCDKCKYPDRALPEHAGWCDGVAHWCDEGDCDECDDAREELRIPLDDCAEGRHEYQPGGTVCVYCEFSPVSLHVVRGRNSYCGPAAVSAITGCTTDEAAREMRRFSGRRMIKGAYLIEVEAALAAHGFKLWQFPAPTRLTLGMLVEQHEHELAKHRAVLVASGGHYRVISGCQWVDSIVRYPRHVSELLGKRERVRVVKAVERRRDA